jgi:hypothetical protein
MAVLVVVVVLLLLERPNECLGPQQCLHHQPPAVDTTIAAGGYSGQLHSYILSILCKQCITYTSS